MWSTPSLFPGSLCPRVVIPVRVPSMGQIEVFKHLLYLKPFNCMQTINFNTWNRFTVCKQISSNLFKNSYLQTILLRTIYIYIYFGSISSLIQILLNIIDIFCLKIFLLILSYCCIDFSIQRELIDIFSIIVYFPSTFCLTLGHHQGRMYYKSDVTFVCTLLLCKKKTVWAIAVCSVYF